MNQTEVAAAVNLIKVSLHSRPDKNITGAVFGELIRKVTPALDIRELFPTGKNAATRFIDKYFDGFLVRTGKQGSDNLYSIGELSPDAETLISYDYWRSFVRPNAKMRVVLFGDPVSFALSSHGEVSRDERIINNITPIELDVVRRQFVESQSQVGVESNLPSMDMPYPVWSETLKSSNYPLYKTWTTFRIQTLLGVFADRLRHAGVPEDRLEFLMDIMRRSQASRKPNTPTLPNTAGLAKVGSTPRASQLTESMQTESSTDDEFRSIVLQAVSNMSIADLRELKLPAGTLLDAFLSKLKK
jgi:hypothetical protein